MSKTALRKYVGESMRLNKSIKRPLYLVAETMPLKYNQADFLNAFKQLYPLVWKMLSERHDNYNGKDKFLKEIGKKPIYNCPSAEKYLLELHATKNILSNKYKAQRIETFDKNKRQQQYATLKKKSESKLEKKRIQVDKYTELIQEIEPYFIEALIAAYHQRGITTEGKMEILLEMKKYNCEKVLEFFYKINDAELNFQIRNLAFQHLQKCGRYVKLRGKPKGKEKSYMVDTTNFNMTPKDLAKRLKTNSVQSQKRYGIFISHSYKDGEIVKKVVSILNKRGLSCYYDWSSDNDFLKRSLVSEFTKIVLKKRIEQSDKMLLIRTSNSMDGFNVSSEWIQMELDHCAKINKPILYLDLLNDGNVLNYKKIDFNLSENRIEI